MRRTQSSQLLTRGPVKALPQSVIHADSSGIYVNATNGGQLVRYTHEFKLATEYPFQNYIPIDRICSYSHMSDISDQLICYNYAAIYAVPSLRISSQLCLMRTTLPSIVTYVIYHPIRNTYLVTTSSGKTIELDTNFLCVREFAPGCSWPGRQIQPSKHSSIIYSIGPSVYGARLYMWDPPSTAYPTANVAGYSQLLMRPGDQETLAIVSMFSVSLSDAAHTSASGLSEYLFTRITSKSIASEHINSNVCVICTDNNMFVIDYRFGLAQSIRTEISGPRAMWVVGDRIYVADQHSVPSKCALYMIPFCVDDWMHFLTAGEKLNLDSEIYNHY